MNLSEEKEVMLNLMAPSQSYNHTVLAHWESFISKVEGTKSHILIDGRSVDLASVIAVARHGASIGLNDNEMQRVSQSAKAVQASLEEGNVIYGVNTGFGGSADTRTNAVEELQRLLTRGLHYGMLMQPARHESQGDGGCPQDTISMVYGSLPLDDPVAATCMPESWARAAMMIRLNSLSSGKSGVQLSTLNSLVQLLEHDITPRIPIRGSISASGDLSPLSYIGGVMQGKPTLTAWAGNRRTGQRRILKANMALAEANIAPIELRAKEGLAIVNGTAMSAGVAALAMHEAHSQAILSQVLTAMSVEALRGTDESFDPFFSKVRPHPGQEESARNIYAFLGRSKLVHRSDGSEEASLRQDRYSIRTAPQWIGPVLEDLFLAHRQVMIEVNSVTDNPLVDTDQNRILHGGNFQAKAITSAMEKVRQGCQSIGRMLSVQCTELINPATSRGLPPNLVVDEPSESYIWKGTDIMIAALQSELGFLANPVGSHVQSAEMGNQALNSLALISARYTLDALDVLTQISAIYMIALCQAVDLRVMNLKFLEMFRNAMSRETHKAFEGLAENDEWLDRLEPILWAAFEKGIDQTSGMDSKNRFAFIIASLQPRILEVASSSLGVLVALKAWTERCSFLALEDYTLNRDSYILAPDATPFLGLGSRHIYCFVRERLRVPFMQEKTIRTPEPEAAEEKTDGSRNSQREAVDTPTVGSLMTTVYESMRTGALYVAVMKCLQEADGLESNSRAQQ
ncbi:hypothetical protein MMC22_005046 [Lobaria immixta]|nr:hypothetical protein [Lobaria immixta]